jgi:hypothetical protein
MANSNYKFVVSSHENPALSGVAKFGLDVASKTGAKFVSIKEEVEYGRSPVFFSLKLTDAKSEDFDALEKLLERFKEQNVTFDLFMHQFSNHVIEKEFFSLSRYIYCGNNEMFSNLGEYKDKGILAWCPPSVDFKQDLESSSILQIFSFGMAHKVKVNYHEQMKNALEKLQVDFSLWISYAFHEKANFSDFKKISLDLHNIYGDKMRYLGFLSDDGVNYFLNKSHMAIAFFEDGVRANNTSVYASMQRKCAVITNLDNYSPDWLAHGKNILDIKKLEKENLLMESIINIGENAYIDAYKYARWDSLIELFAKHS